MATRGLGCLQDETTARQAFEPAAAEIDRDAMFEMRILTLLTRAAQLQFNEEEAAGFERWLTEEN